MRISFSGMKMKWICIAIVNVLWHGRCVSCVSSSTQSWMLIIIIIIMNVRAGWNELTNMRRRKKKTLKANPMSLCPLFRFFILILFGHVHSLHLAACHLSDMRLSDRLHCNKNFNRICVELSVIQSAWNGFSHVHAMIPIPVRCASRIWWFSGTHSQPPSLSRFIRSPEYSAGKKKGDGIRVMSSVSSLYGTRYFILVPRAVFSLSLCSSRELIASNCWWYRFMYTIFLLSEQLRNWVIYCAREEWKQLHSMLDDISMMQKNIDCVMSDAYEWGDAKELKVHGVLLSIKYLTIKHWNVQRWMAYNH